MNEQQIIAKVAEVFEFSPDQILKKGRKTDVLYVRYIAIAILKEEGFSLSKIAEVFDQWTRNSIEFHCQATFDSLLNYNRKFKDMYLLAVKAVEDMQDENENEKKSA